MSGLIFNSSLDVVCSADIVNMWCEYHSALQMLTDILHVDPDFSFVYLGSGFDGSPPLCSWKHLPCFHGKSNNRNSYYLTCAVPSHAVLIEHRHSLAHQEVRVNLKDRRPLQYYIDTGATPVSVRLQLSGRTHTNMLRGSYGLPFTLASTAVLDDRKGGQKFYLSSEEFKTSYNKVFRERRILSTFRSILGKLEINGGRGIVDELYDRQIHMLEGLGDGVYSKNMVPAIWCPDWPRAAFHWQSRKRTSNWPPQLLRSEVVKAGCHILPVNNSKEEFKYEWAICFAQAETRLMATLGDNIHKTLFLLKAMLQNLFPVSIAPAPHPLHAVLLWSLEEKTPEEWRDVMSSFKFVSTRLLDCLSNKCIPHYFIPEWNLLESMDATKICLTAKAIASWLTNPMESFIQNPSLPFMFLKNCGLDFETLMHREQRDDTKTNISEEIALLSGNVLSMLDSCLQLSFTEAVHFGILSAYNYTHQIPVLNSMLLIRDQIRVLDTLQFPKKYTEPYKQFLQSTLGVLYHARGLASRGKREREYLVCKAGELLLANKHCDKTLGHIRLAHYQLIRGQPKMALHTLESVIQWLEHGSTRNLQPVLPDEVGSEGKSVSSSPLPFNEAFKKRLWDMWVKKQFSFDLMIAKSTSRVRLPIMASNTSFTAVQILGITKESVSIFSAVVMAYLFQALSLILVKDAITARCVLENLEVIVDEEYEDGPLQKRGIAYINLLACAYLQLGDKDKAVQIYKRSVHLLGNPRNPARWKLMTLRHGGTWQAIKQGAKLLAFTAIASLVLSFVKAQFG